MRDKLLLVIGACCALAYLQVARTQQSDYEIDYDEEGFWIGHGLGNRKEGACCPFPHGVSILRAA